MESELSKLSDEREEERTANEEDPIEPNERESHGGILNTSENEDEPCCSKTVHEGESRKCVEDTNEGDKRSCEGEKRSCEGEERSCEGEKRSWEGEKRSWERAEADLLSAEELDIPSPSPYVLQAQRQLSQQREQHFSTVAAERMMEALLGRVLSNVQSAAEIRTKGSPLEEESVEMLSKKVSECERRLKTISRHLRESQRAKHHLLEQIDSLEKRLIDKLKADLLERIASVPVPCEYDVALLDLLNKHLREHNERSKMVQESQTRNRAMERIMNKADDILLEAPWFRGGLNLPREPERNLRFNKFHREVIFKKSDAADEIQQTKESLIAIKALKEESETSFLVVDQVLRKQEEAIPKRLSDLQKEAVEELNTTQVSPEDGKEEAEPTENERLPDEKDEEQKHTGKHD